MRSLSDMEWTRAYHILRCYSADIDRIREAFLNHDFRGLILHCLEEYGIEIGPGRTVFPGEDTIFSRGHSGDRKNTELVRGGGAIEVGIVLRCRYQQNGAVGDGTVFRIAYHSGHNAA